MAFIFDYHSQSGKREITLGRPMSIQANARLASANTVSLVRTVCL